jgi:UDP-glucose 4-epimerase
MTNSFANMQSPSKSLSNRHKPIIGVLGCSGFIGYAMLKTAKELSIPARGLTRQSRSMWRNDQLTSLMEEGDANNHGILDDLFSSVDTVIDCASSLKPSSTDDSDYLMEAIRLDQRIRIAARKGIFKYIYISSGGALYTDVMSTSSEKTEPRPTSKYGLGKQMCEDVIAFHSRKGDLEVISARTSNPYGEYHTSPRHGFINVFIRNMLHHRHTTIYGDPDIIQKDYIYIRDTTRAIIDLTVYDTVGHCAVNVGSGSTHSLTEIIESSSTQLGTEALIQIVPSKSHDNLKFALDISLLQSLTGFLPKYTLTDGICATIKWERAKAGAI